MTISCTFKSVINSGTFESAAIFFSFLDDLGNFKKKNKISSTFKSTTISRTLECTTNSRTVEVQARFLKTFFNNFFC